MLVSANKQSLMTPIPKKPGEDPTAEAAAGLQSAMLQTLQGNVQAQTAQVQKSATQNATQQVSEASKISDNVDEAFAKTRVGLQLTYAPLPTDAQGKFSGGTATDAFKEYMSKTPEERMQEAILEEMGLTKEEVEQMPPEQQQQAVAKEMADRMQDKIKLAQAENENGGSEKGSPQVVDKFLASL
ncbi:hypothetical protein FBY04_110168 [Pseudomonas sp. SJZ080]|uniref:hypothetical protein n=1 Tax=Pseudomonas sp. SJZ080 TaxID=2572888 RepID=UPI0011996CEC|nr:hypothetical protein [Pseudomonas sp. SJZ080]TWC55405.1 hypothetical protein FBY04_110168 [Pseudomonas sp. SJZ080]